MAAFARVWPTGLVFNEVPGSANLTALDLNVSRAVSGDGGTWSPVTPIIFGGAGLQVTSTLTIPSAGNLVVASGGAVTINGAATFNNSVTFRGGSTIVPSTNFTENAVAPYHLDAFTTNSFVDGTPLVSITGAQVDNELLLLFSTNAEYSGGAGDAELRFYVDVPGGSYFVLPGLSFVSATAGKIAVSMHARHRLTANSNVTIKVQGRIDSGGTLRTLRNATLTVLRLPGS